MSGFDSVDHWCARCNRTVIRGATETQFPGLLAQHTGAHAIVDSLNDDQRKALRLVDTLTPEQRDAIRHLLGRTEPPPPADVPDDFRTNS